MAKNRNTNDARQKRPKKQLTIVEGPRVRYAPAPTGPLHVGGARTVLFNWLFARKYGGSFIIRIEDTDVERSDPKFEKDILDSIRWLGLDWDEGPDIGGSYGPYRQSERLTIYAKYIKKLLDEDKAYRCFCSEEDLKAERQEMLSRGVPPKYSGRCKTLSKEEVEKNLKDGKFFLVRIKMPAKIVEVEDLIRGKVRFDTNLIGDIAISKKEDIPLYNFAAVVDDYEMKISHVIRGEDHLSNTPKQIVLQELLGFAHPEYAHLPLILGPDRTKLSKRHGAVGISEYRKLGYLPEALINFLSLLGWHVAGDREIFSKEDLIREFTLDRVQKAGAVFNQKRLDWLNSYYIRIKPTEELLERALSILLDAGLIKKDDKNYINPETGNLVSKEFLTAILELEKERIQKLSDLPEMTEFFFKRPKYGAELLSWKEMSLDDIKLSIRRLIETLDKIQEDEFNAKKIAEALTPFYGTDKGWILWPFRVALSGRRTSPGPFEISQILGKKEVMARLNYAKELLEKI